MQKPVNTTPTLNHALQNALQHINDTTRYRHRRVITAKTPHCITIDGNIFTNFSSNDYLQLSTHPAVKKAFIQGALKFGVGSTASTLVSGHTVAHQQLEDDFANFLGRERALAFNSGYHANLGVITALAQSLPTHFYVDRHCHASLIDGILLSRMRYHRYQHKQVHHVDKLLQHHAINRPSQHCSIVTDSVFSIDGDICHLPALLRMASKYHATLIVDDAHGLGVLGNGEGINAHYHVPTEQITCLISPLGKAIGGLGAIVSGQADLITYLTQVTRSYIYTTALPAATCYANITALQLIQTESWRLARLRHLIQLFIDGAKKRDVPLTNTDITPIKSIRLPTNQAALQLQQQLMNQQLLVACMRPPSSPDRFPRIRISLNCHHQEATIDTLLDILAEHVHASPH